MPRLNSCPIDNGQLEFIGISRHGTNRIDTETGERIFDRYRWQQCQLCSFYTKEDFFGTILSIGKQEPNRDWFKVPHGD